MANAEDPKAWLERYPLAAALFDAHGINIAANSEATAAFAGPGQLGPCLCPLVEALTQHVKPPTE